MDLYKFSELNKLGEGTYGTVFKGKEKSTGRAVAVKRAKDEVCTEEGIPVTVIREISMLKWLNRAGEHVVKLENHFFEEKDPSVLLVFERHDYDLKKFAEKHSTRYPGSTKKGWLRPDLIKVLMRELLKGADLLHSQGMVHRDLKPQNILVSTRPDRVNPVVKIADLGLARNQTIPIMRYTHEVMTLWYRAPEILLGAEYNYQVDMWSIGCIFAELFQGRPLFHADCELFQLIRIFEMLGLPNEDIWPGVTKCPYWHEYPNFKPGKLDATMVDFMSGDDDALDLLKRMLHYDPTKRIHAAEALQHPYFTAGVLKNTQR